MESVPFYFAVICGGFFFLILLVLGGGLVFYSLRSRKKADQSHGWPSTNGKVIVSETRESKTAGRQETLVLLAAWRCLEKQLNEPQLPIARP